jgi:hypothetical protein
MTGRRANTFASVTVRLARWDSVVCAPEQDILELPHDVWSTVPATPGVMLAIRSGALEVKKTKREKATPPRAPAEEG